MEVEIVQHLITIEKCLRYILLFCYLYGIYIIIRTIFSFVYHAIF